MHVNRDGVRKANAHPARWVGATGALAVFGGTATLLGAVPAAAAPGETCETTTPTATLISDGVCELRITADGTYNFPSSITKLSAVLVGGGGGGVATSSDYGGYPGGGGAVVYVDSVALGTDLSVVIGAGGASADGQATSLETDVAAGGLAAVGNVGGSSGNGNPGSTSTLVNTSLFAFGGGQGGAATTTSAGPGVPLSAVATDATLFPAALDGSEVFGAGGIGVELGQPSAAVVPNSGQGGSTVGGAPSTFSVGSATPGAAGVIIMRFPATPPAPAPAPDPTLAATGASDASATVLAGGIALVGGAVALAAAGRMRARRNP